MVESMNVERLKERKTMKKIYTYLAMFVAAATMVACENAPEGNVTPDATGKPINITIGAQNRALLDLTDGKSVTWEAGDKIGLYHKVGDNVATADAAYTAASDGESTTFTGEATWSGSAEDAHEFYVYYPRRGDANSADPTYIAKTLSKKQYYDAAGSWENFGTDYSFAYAKANEVTYGGEVTFPALKQFFGILRLRITNATGEDIVINDVVLTSNDGYLQGTHRIDITKDPATWQILASSNEITCYVENGTVAAGESIDVRFAISPQDYTDKKFTVVVNSDKGVHPAVEFDAKNVGLGGRVSKNIAIEAVPTTKYKVGDVFNNEGVIFWISADKTQAKIVAGPSEKKAYCTNKTTVTNTTSDNTNASLDDGTKNMAVVAAVDPGYENHPAFKYCADMGEGWYLPARREVKALIAGYHGVATYNDVSADGVDPATPDTHCYYFNSQLKSIAGGVALDSKSGGGDSVFTSNEKDAVNAYYFNVNKKQATDPSGSKTSTARYARCIKVVELTE